MSKANLALYKIQQILKDKEFISKHRLVAHTFTRKRKLPLEFEGFVELNDKALEVFYTDNNEGLWKGFRLIAADGSTSRLPTVAEIIRLL
jgi:hypothetical protein